MSQGGTAIPTGTEANPNTDTKVNVSQDGTANDADVKDGSDAPDSNGKPSIEADDEPAESAQEDSLRDAFREIFQTITKDSTTTSVSKKKFKQALMSIPSLGEMIASAEPALSPLLSGKGFAKKLDDIDGDKDAEITIDEMVDFCRSLSKSNN